MELREFVYNALTKQPFEGVRFVNFAEEQQTFRLVLEIGHTIVDFVIGSDERFRILSVYQEGVKYEDALHLQPFDDYVGELVKVFLPLIKEKVADFENDKQSIAHREAQAKLKEEQLLKRGLTLDARGQILNFQKEAMDMEQQMLADEQAKLEARVVRKWTLENIYLLKWLSITIMTLMAVILVILIVLNVRAV